MNQLRGPLTVSDDHRVLKERRICACRVVIEADPVPEEIEHAVKTHLRQPEHIRYQVLTQLRGDYVAPQKLAGLAGLRRVS